MVEHSHTESKEEHSESRENYIKAILVLKKEKGVVRSIDIAEYFDFSRPSVSRAMSILRADGVITMDNSGYIELTDTGKKLAKNVYNRHQILIQLLKLVGVSDETAESDGCRIEHYLTQESIDKIKEYVNAHKND